MKKVSIIVIIILLGVIGMFAFDKYKTEKEVKQGMIKELEQYKVSGNKTFKQEIEEDNSDFIEGFMEGCMEAPIVTEGYCECMTDKMFEEYDVEELMEFSIEYIKTDEYPDELLDIAIECVDKL